MTQTWMQRLAGRFGRQQSVQAAAVDASGLTIDQLAAMYDVGVTADGMPAVNAGTAMRAVTVYGCVSLIAGAVTSLPLPVYRRSADDAPRSVDHPTWWLLNERPHPTLSAATFWDYIVTSKLLRGDAFAEILRPSQYTSVVTGLYPIHPDRMRVELVGNELQYEWTDQDGRIRRAKAADMLHFTSLGFNGERSPSPISLAGQSAIGIALAAEEHSGSFFANRARPDVVLSTEKPLDQKQIELLRGSWIKAYGGAKKSGLPAVVGGGMKVDTLTVSGDDAQLLESRKFQVEEICRLFGVPPFMLGHTEKTSSWGQGVDNMGRGFVKFTLRRHLEQIEQELNHKLWPVRERYYVEFLTAGLEQGDYKTRMDGYRIALGRAGEPGWMTVNEVRKLENLPKHPDGDELNTGLPDAADPTGTPDDEPTDQPAGE